MDAGTIFRRYQQEKEVGRFPIHGFKIHPCGGTPEGQSQLIKVLDLSMWNGDSVTDSGAPQTLSLQQHFHYPSVVKLRFMPEQGGRQLVQNLEFGASF